MKCLVLAGGYDQIDLIKELKKRNAYVILIDYFENPPAKVFADKHYKISTLDTEEVKKIAILEKVELITTACTDQALLTMAKVSEELKLTCYLSYEKALNVTNKRYMKDKMRENSIPTANYVILDNYNEKVINNFKYPIVVKPVDCNSSKGVKKVFSNLQLKKSISDAMELSRTKNVIIEEFKEGIEISVDAYVEDYKAKVILMTESQKIKNKNGFTILRSSYPVNISKEICIKIKNIAQKISHVFGINNSPLLIQLITDGKEINVIEFSARMGGGTKHKLIKSIMGVDFMDIYVRSILGDKPCVEYAEKTKFARLNYCYCSPGVFEKLENFSQLKRRQIIYDYFQYKSRGMKITKAETSSDRVAGYILVAESIEKLEYKQEISKNELKIIDNSGANIILDI